MDDSQNWHHFQTVVANVWNFAVAYSNNHRVVSFVGFIYLNK